MHGKVPYKRKFAISKRQSEYNKPPRRESERVRHHSSISAYRRWPELSFSETENVPM